MNLLQTVAMAAGVLSTVAGGVYALETRVENKVDVRVAPIEKQLGDFVPISEYKDFQWVFFKRELRDLADAIEDEEDPGLRRRLQADYDAVLDRFCRSYPDDREC